MKVVKTHMVFKSSPVAFFKKYEFYLLWQLIFIQTWPKLVISQVPYRISWSSSTISPQHVNTKDIQYASEVVTQYHQASSK
jgi:hypothetical protein